MVDIDISNRVVAAASISIFDHPRSGVVCNVGRFCLSVCQTITFENLGRGSLYFCTSIIQCISSQYRSSSYTKVIGSRSRSQEH